MIGLQFYGLEIDAQVVNLIKIKFRVERAVKGDFGLN